MHEHITSKTQYPTQKFHKILINFQNPHIFQENPKPRLKCVKCMKNERKRDHTGEEMITLGQNPSGFEV